MSRFEMRVLTEKDKGVIEEYNKNAKHAIDYDYWFNPENEERKEDRDMILSEYGNEGVKEFVVGAFRDNCLVGAIQMLNAGVTGMIPGSGFSCDNRDYIFNLCVHNDYQGQNIGTLLVNRARNMIKDPSRMLGILQADDDANFDRLVDFYKQFGCDEETLRNQHNIYIFPKPLIPEKLQTELDKYDTDNVDDKVDDIVKISSK